MFTYLHEGACSKCNHPFCDISKIHFADAYNICFECHSCDTVMWASCYIKPPKSNLDLMLALGEFKQICPGSSIAKSAPLKRERFG